jgi:methanogenic corrinoid protein MtbC1
MNHEAMIERLFETLISGNRPATRAFVRQAEAALRSPEAVISDLFWPTHEMIQKLYRADQLPCLNHHMAVRLLRVMADQEAAKLTIQPLRGRSVFALCGPSEAEELGAQMAVDLIEAAGFDICFAGGGIANDEVLARVHEESPDVLLMFSSAAQDLPNIRALIDQLHEIGACPNLQIAVGGGVFNRAEGLAEEIGADVYGSTPLEMVDILIHDADERSGLAQRTVGRNRVKKRAAA